MEERLVGERLLERAYADIGHSRSLAPLREALAARVVHYGLEDLQAAAIRLRAPPALHPGAVEFVYECSGEGGRQFDGIQYRSRLGNEFENWALLEPAPLIPRIQTSAPPWRDSGSGSPEGPNRQHPDPVGVSPSPSSPWGAEGAADSGDQAAGHEGSSEACLTRVISSSLAMHLCYVDEAGATGKNLSDPNQPVFVMAGLLVSDEKWRKTESEIRRVIDNAYGGLLPADFELHASELLSPEGEGPFAGWDRDRRNALAFDLLQLVAERRHQLLIQIVNKSQMAKTTPPDRDFGFDWKDPWEVAFVAVLTMAEEFLRSTRTGRSSTGMVVIDHEPSYLEVVRSHSRQRQLARGWQQVRKVVEIGYSATSHANPMIQLTDLVAFTMKKWAESEAGHGDGWPPEAKAFFKKCRDTVWDRVELKMLKFSKLNVPDELTNYLRAIRRLR